MTRTANVGSPRILGIGRPDPAFTSVAKWLQSNVPIDQLVQAPTIPLALKSPFFSRSLPDLVLVFREFPDQFPTADIHGLVGAMLFRRVICCDGPLCLADGRTHGQWPTICRVPEKSAIAVLRQELHALKQARPPVSPMAASEDVFAHRVFSLPCPTSDCLPPQRAFVAACDPDFRATVRSVLMQHNIHAESAHPDVLNALQAAGSLAPDWLLVDLDEDPATLIPQLNTMHRQGLPITALTGFPGQTLPTWAASLVDKTEMFLQLGALHQDLTR